MPDIKAFDDTIKRVVAFEQELKDIITPYTATDFVRDAEPVVTKDMLEQAIQELPEDDETDLVSFTAPSDTYDDPGECTGESTITLVREHYKEDSYYIWIEESGGWAGFTGTKERLMDVLSAMLLKLGSES